MYGSASGIIFNESGHGHSEVVSSAGIRQRCSWQSFLHYLTIHPLLKQLADEFPGCVILAPADDCPYHWPALASSGSVWEVAFPLCCLAPRRTERLQEHTPLTKGLRGGGAGRRYAHGH